MFIRSNEMELDFSFWSNLVSPVPTRYAYSKCGSICKSDQNEMVSISDSRGRHVLEEPTGESSDEPV